MLKGILIYQYYSHHIIIKLTHIIQHILSSFGYPIIIS